MRAPVPAAQASAARAAYVDVDGTLARTNIVGPLIYFHRRIMQPILHKLWLATIPPRGLYWLLLDKISREASNRAIYACYAGLNAAQVKALAQDCHRDFWTPRLYPQALERMRALKAEGVAIVLVTGSIDFLVEPLARDLGAELIAPSLEEKNGCFTGNLNGPPLAGRHKEDAVRKHAREKGIDLAASCAYGDAIGDLPMLQCVGHPVAINPGSRLHAIARKRGWAVEKWRIS
ncbi:MAG: HAD-IB family hydrolase [Planctomycetota bacterium]|nr:HAD-IB family hydrolase [Planctomycetota bacterium]